MILINEVLVDPAGIDALKPGKWVSQKSGTTVDGILIYTKHGVTIPIECASPEQARREYNAACEIIMKLDQENKAKEESLDRYIGEIHAVSAAVAGRVDEMNKRQKELRKKLDNLNRAVGELRKPITIHTAKPIPVTGDAGGADDI